MMRTWRAYPLMASAMVMLSAIAGHSQATSALPRIVSQIDERQLVTLKGNTHPAVDAINDMGRVNPEVPMGDLILVLSRGPEQQAAFDKFVADQYDSHSPDFHRWLEPAQVGEFFGPSQTDIQTLSNWLTGRGFSVYAVSKDRMTIRFSGSSGQVETTFHTEMHSLLVGGETHIANMTDPQVPAAIAPAIVGIKGLHNFFPRPMHRLGSRVQFNKQLGKWQRLPETSGGKPSPSLARPEFGINVGSGSSAYTVEDVAPYDFATIYNVLPLWKASSPIDGTGQKIAIAGTSNINLADITSFRSTFGLPAYTSSNQPKVIVAHGSDPGNCSNAASSCDGDLTENTLDVEWAGAVAKGAQITLVISGSTSATDDTLYDSAAYVVQNKTAPILSVSYGACELAEGTSGNALYNTLWQTAASEGIAVFVASGDSGAALCDAGQSSTYGNPWAAQYGLSVNGLASSQYDTAVGGTDFNWGSTASPYWSASNNSTTGANAVGYVPEIPWNDTCANPLPLVLKYLQTTATNVNFSGTAVSDTETACNFVATDAIHVFQNDTSNGSPLDIAFFVDEVGGGGGTSNCSTNTTTGTTAGTCTKGYAKPSWQVGHSISAANRDLPDVSFFSSNGFLGSAYLICVSANGACVSSTSLTAEPFAQEVGGTSVGTPAMAGVMALINQKTGSAQGNPNAEFYSLASTENYASCSAESVTASSTSCYFNDIDTGTISTPCDYGAANGGIVNTTGTPTYVASDVQTGVKSLNCTPKHSGDTVGILPGVDAAVGYDLSTGLGSLNVANVVNGFIVTPSFSISGTDFTLAAGATTSNTTGLTVTPTGGFTGTVALTCSAPSPLTCSASPASVSITQATAVNSTLTVLSDSTAGGTYPVTVTGTSGSLTAAGTVQVTVNNPASTFTMTLGSATGSPATVAPGATATDTVALASVLGYGGTVVFTCKQTSGPTNSATDSPICAFNGAAQSMGSTTSFSVETIAQVSSAVTYPNFNHNRRGWTGAGGGAVLALLILFGIPGKRRRWQSMLGVLLALAALGSLAACGGGGGGGGQKITDPGTAAGTYVFTVTGTGTPAPSTTPAAVTFTVVVN